MNIEGQGVYKVTTISVSWFPSLPIKISLGWCNIIPYFQEALSIFIWWALVYKNIKNFLETQYI